MHLIRPISEANTAGISPKASQRCIRSGDAHPAVGLNVAVDHRLGHVWGNHFEQRHQFFVVLDAFTVNLVGCGAGNSPGPFRFAMVAVRLSGRAGDRAGAVALAQRNAAALQAVRGVHDSAALRSQLAEVEADTANFEQMEARSSEGRAFGLSRNARRRMRVTTGVFQ